LDYYCCQNNIITVELTQAEKDHLHVLCSKLINLQTKGIEAFKEFQTPQNQNPSSVSFEDIAAIFLIFTVV